MFFLFLMTNFLMAQDVHNEDRAFRYQNFFTGGAQFHSNGWGINARKGINPNVKWNRFYELDIVSMKDSKEIKMYHPFYDNVRGYVYGKINACVPVRVGYGFERMISDRTHNSIQVQIVSSAVFS